MNYGFIYYGRYNQIAIVSYIYDGIVILLRHHKSSKQKFYY
jgi:hypothetical protein